MLLHAATIFLSAFLLFQVQPIIARMILPWFGGSSAVWSTCMLFFQAALLAGYGYAHWLHERVAPRWQAIVHTTLLAISLLVLPVAADPSWRPRPGEDPAWRILSVLAVTIGLPYFLLAATSPLLQAWHARSFAGSVPYRLFALSNFASLLALLTYPPLVEPYLASRGQGRAWSVLYVGFAGLCAAAAWRASKHIRPSSAQPDGEVQARPAWSVRLLWVGLAACASILFLSVTSALTQDVAPVPFLWIVPLSLYLLSFIICFDRPSLYQRPVFMPLLLLALTALVWLSWNSRRPFFHLPLTVLFFSLALFVCCMVCHGELARLKPDPRYLTLFYVMVSVGGATGGLLVGLAAPSLFRTDYEFAIGLILCAVLAAFVMGRRARRPVQVLLTLCAVSYTALVVYARFSDTSGYLFLGRNFYGRLAVYDNSEIDEDHAARVLVHGGINHGQQMLFPKYRRTPVSYFCEESGIGRALRARPNGMPWRIGVLGMGSGTLATYGRAGDLIRMYEINPLVPKLARAWFTYLKDTPAHVETRLGDGRLELEREESGQYDLLVMDAFSGDSVPVHLLTLEAFRTYFRHLRPGGILALNVTNRYLDLRPVMERAAAHYGRTAWYYSLDERPDAPLCFACDWVLMLDAGTSAAAPELLRETAMPLSPAPSFRPWTDDFSNLMSILR